MSEPAVKVAGLTRRFGSRKAVDDVSFELPRGAFLAVFGPNGAGKTTLLRTLATLARPSAGTVEVAGFDVRENPDEVRSAVGGLIAHEAMLLPPISRRLRTSCSTRWG